MTTLVICGMVHRSLELVSREGPLGPLLRLAQPLDGADHATVEAGDGQFRASIPLDRLTEGRLEHGRLVIDDAPTRCWSVKDVVRVELTCGARPDSLPRGGDGVS